MHVTTISALTVPIPLSARKPVSRVLKVSATASTHRIAGLRKISSQDLVVNRPAWWLESKFHFSFANYLNPDNLNFGKLRVLNDDIVKPQAGFPSHLHSDMEIFSYVVSGYLTHEDSMNNKETLGRGCVQYMSAGTGVWHSERNEHPTEDCRVLQIWILPDQAGGQPQYGSRQFTAPQRHNQWLQVVGGRKDPPKMPNALVPSDLIHLCQDFNVYATELDPKTALEFQLKAHRQAYMVCIEGAVDVNGLQQLAAQDAMEVQGEATGAALTFRAMGQPAHVLLLEMQQSNQKPVIGGRGIRGTAR